MISFNLCSCSIALSLRELGVKIRELGAGLRPAELANPDPPEPPMFKDGRGRAGRLDHEPAGLDVPEDNDGGPKLGGPGLESRPGIVRAFILALISSAFAFMLSS